jgi:excisionase family DNA binding protein
VLTLIYDASVNDFLTVPEFAKRMGVADAAVYTAIKQKRVSYVKILGRLGIPRSELSRFKRRKDGAKTKVLRKAA